MNNTVILIQIYVKNNSQFIRTLKQGLDFLV